MRFQGWELLFGEAKGITIKPYSRKIGTITGKVMQAGLPISQIEAVLLISQRGKSVRFSYGGIPPGEDGSR